MHAKSLTFVLEMTTLFSAMFTVYKNTYSWFSTSTKFLMTVQKPDMLALCTWYRINQLYILVKSQSNLTSNLMSFENNKMNINVIYIMISGTISMCIAWIFGSNICIVLTAWCREDSGKMHGERDRQDSVQTPTNIEPQRSSDTPRYPKAFR